MHMTEKARQRGRGYDPLAGSGAISGNKNVGGPWLSGEPEEDLFPLGHVSVQGLWSPGGHAY